MKLISFRGRIFLGTAIAFVVCFGRSYAMGEGSWGSMGAGLNCTGMPRTLCPGGEGSGGNRSIPKGPECNDAGEELLAQGDIAKAKDIFKEILAKAGRQDPKLQAACLHFLGLASKQEGLRSTNSAGRKKAFEKAVYWYRQLVDIEPSNMEALQALLSIYEESGNKDLAEKTRRLIKNVGDKAGQSSCLDARQPKLAEGVLLPSSILLASLDKVESDGCPTFKLDPAPRWTFSGILASDNTLFLADTLGNMILRYEFPQKSKPIEFRSFEHFKSPIVAPSALKLMDRGYILQYGKSLLSLQNEDNTTIWQFDVTAGARSAQGSITSLDNWVIAGDYIFGFSDILFADGVYKPGLFKAPLRDLGAFTAIPGLTLDQADPEAGFYLIGSSYLTAIGNRAFFLAMEALPVVYELDSHGDSRKSYPVYKFAEPYKRPGLLQSPDTIKVLDASAKATMPIGLYSAGRFLYVIMRIPRTSAIDWEIFKIDPDQEVLISHRVLPMHSKHLVVIQGSKFWGFLEKGDFDTTGGVHQKIGELWLVPTERVTADGNMPICATPGAPVRAELYPINQSTETDTVQLQGVPLDIHE
jgi:tetratricopeptide (TPR) repeat protein